MLGGELNVFVVVQLRSDLIVVENEHNLALIHSVLKERVEEGIVWSESNLLSLVIHKQSLVKFVFRVGNSLTHPEFALKLLETPGFRNDRSGGCVARLEEFHSLLHNFSILFLSKEAVVVLNFLD